ncbi:MAG: transposase domain-containing protein, partial [bacterium]|nr:transposase domain-containing protein [bacterium]
MYDARQTPGPTGPKWEISLDSLPKEAQERYYEQQRIAEQVAKAKRGGRPSKAKLEARAKAEAEAAAVIEANKVYLEAPDWQKSEVDRRVYILESTKGLSQKEAMAWVDEYNLRNADRPCKCSLSTLSRWRKLYSEGGKNALMTGYGKRKGQSIIEDDVFSVFYSVYAKEGKVSTKTAWIIARGYYTEHYEGECPSLGAFEYRLKHDPNISEQEIYFARHGASAYNRKYGYYIERDLSKLIAGQCAVGDHMQFDLMVKMPDGKVVRPWLTAWVDMKSRRFLGWCPHPEAPNSSHIFQSFYHMADRCGLPEALYLDNGRDYRSKDFAGGRRRYSDEDKERITSCLTGDLGIEVTFALPRNAQAKVIERRFRDHHDKFERLFKGYTGTNIAYKPEALNEQVKKQEVLSWDRFLELLGQFLETLDRIPFGAKAHFSKLSPVEIWNADNPALRRVSKDSLALFCMRSSRPIKVGRAGVKD